MTKKKIGIVVSNINDKTIIVAVQTRYQHPIYGKTIIKTKRYAAHDQKNEANIGDIVVLQESRPISKHKKWILKQILKFIQNN